MLVVSLLLWLPGIGRNAQSRRRPLAGFSPHTDCAAHGVAVNLASELELRGRERDEANMLTADKTRKSALLPAALECAA